MSIEVTGPDGAVHEFPDQTAPATIKDVMRKHYGQTTPGGTTPKAVSKETGAVDSFVRGAANALTFGFGDRIAAELGSLTGIGGKKGEYYKNLEDQRAVDEANAQEHPAASIGGTVVGSLAFPAGAAARAVTLPERMAAGARAGMIQGGAYGAGSAPDLTNTPDVAQRVGEGAGLGLILGGAAPPVASGTGLLLKAAANKTGIPQAINGVLNPEGAANRAIGNMLQRDAEKGASGLTPEEFTAAAERGQPVVAADVGGPATQRLARTAKNLSPEAEHELKTVTDKRFEGQSNRVSDFLEGIGGGNSVETLDNLRAAADRARAPLYKKAYAEGAGGIWNDELARVSEAPAVQQAIKDATRTGANADIARGFAPVKNPFVEGQNGKLSLGVNANGEPATPNLQFWDHVKRNLDDKIETEFRSGEKHQASVLTNLKKQIVSQLDEASPTYAAARGTAAKAFGAEDALEAGQKFVSAKGKNHEYAKELSKLSPQEKKLFAHGFLSELQRKVSETGDRRSVINQIFNSPAAREKVAMAIGPAKANELEAFLHVERVMDDLRTAVQGNSTTAQQLLDAAAAPAIVGGGTYIGSGGDMREASIAGATAAVLKHGVKGVNAGVMERVAKGLTSSDPEVYARALRTVTKDSSLLRKFRELTPAAVRAALAERSRETKKGKQ
jgi:hypothetical protein